jgi:hypothetical protein
MSEDATAKERFDLLYAKLKHHHDSALDSAFKFAGLLLLMIGWIVTSDSSRNFLKGDVFIRWGAITAILLGAVVYGVVALHVYQTAKKIVRYLDDLGYTLRLYYADLLPNPFIVTIFVIFNFILCVILALFILRIK